MTIYARPGAVFEAVLSGAPTGEVGTMGVRIRNPIAATDVVARVTAGITEQPAASGLYFKSLTAPTVASSPTVAYVVIWDDGAFFAQEELVVTYTLPSPVIPGPTLCDLAQLNEVLGTTGSGNGALKARLLEVCSEHIMNHCDRRFLPSGDPPSARSFRVRPGESVISLVPWDFQAGQAVTVVVDPSGASTTLVLEDDFYIAPENSVWGIADRIILHQRLNASKAVLLEVTATWGWPVIPPPVAEACAYWVRDLIRSVSAYPQEQQFEEAVAIAADGVVPPVSAQLLTRFKHMVVA